MANYKVSQDAQDDLERIWAFGCNRWGVERADRYHMNFFNHFETLAENPHMFPASDIVEGYRRSICGNDSVYYRVIGEDVEIMAVIGRQDAASRFE